MDLSHHQYRGGCAVHGYQKTAQGVVGACNYLGNDILQTILPRFHPNVMNQDVPEILLGC